MLQTFLLFGNAAAMVNKTAARNKIPNPLQNAVLIYDSSYNFFNLISTRRFLALLASLSLGATGRSGP